MVCLGNICRSPIAEGVLRHKAAAAGLDWTIDSAGTEPYRIGNAPHQYSQKVCRNNGIDISSQESKGLDEIPLHQIGHIVTLCGDAADSCATLPGGFTRTHWPLSDPAAAPGTESEVFALFRTVRDQIQERVAALYSKP